MLGHKTNLNTFKSPEIKISTFYDHNITKFEIKGKKTGKFTNMQRVNVMPLNTSVSKIKSKEKFKKLETKIEMQHTKIYGIQQKQFLRGKFLSDLCLPQEIIKASNKQPNNFIHQGARK